MPLEGSHILLGVAGGIACYKSCDLVRALKKAGAEVKVVMTKHATEFVAPLTFETLSGNRVRLDEFSSENFSTAHIEDARWADVLVVAPATANTMAKLAHGIADDMLGTIYLAFQGPVVLAPAMNTVMLEHPATKANLETLGRQNRHIIPPRSSELACGEVGPGAMATLEDMMKAIQYSLGGAQDFEGVRVLVTGGPTREHIDPVRFLSNPSSGKMGLALAEEARKRGAHVTFVHGPLGVAFSRDIEAIPVTSVVEMHERVMERVGECKVLISAAAPGDFVPEERHPQKIKKDGSGTMTLKLKRAPDILADASKHRRPGQILVGFAAETENLVENARKKLKEKDLDMIVANDISTPHWGFASDMNKVVIMFRDGRKEELDLRDKRAVAKTILDHVRDQVTA